MTIDLGYAYWPQPDGIDHALLVVACDDGIMAQTRENLAILQLTGLPTLAAHGWPDAPLFVTAAVQGRGIDAVQEHLCQLSARLRPDHHCFRLAIDRAFTVKGAGMVVTGTALSGQIAVGQTLWLTGADVSVRVLGLHAQNQLGGLGGARRAAHCAQYQSAVIAVMVMWKNQL